MEPTTLVFPVIGKPIEKILLGMKKRGMGQGKWNGFGGKLKVGETVVQCALRELEEESGLIGKEKDLQWVGRIEFYFTGDSSLDHPVDIFLLWEWEGQEVESEEMKPEQYNKKQIPLEKMWADDTFWLPQVLEGNIIEAICHFNSDGETLSSFEIDKKRIL